MEFKDLYFNSVIENSPSSQRYALVEFGNGYEVCILEAKVGYLITTTWMPGRNIPGFELKAQTEKDIEEILNGIKELPDQDGTFLMLQNLKSRFQ